ncbi:hypothetical protein ACI79J_07045 [Geodermatophilus sp. SYSU D01062]
MAELGYPPSCEEHGASDLVRFAAGAEQVGLGYASISDHFHPWLARGIPRAGAADR